MRRTFRERDLSSGCHFCAWEARSTGGVRFARMFDHYQRSGPDPDWPVAMEFALSNRCNLECVMCNGDFSSTIRSRREHRDPLPLVYGDDFFEQLPPFLQHLHLARFFGGEPFLVPEYQRIWDLMIDDGLAVLNSVTTNGTVRTARVEQVLEALPFGISVSVDGITPATIEAVRVGADASVVLDNVAWFRRYCQDRGTEFGLTFCLMTRNWHELAEFLSFADDLDAPVAINTVVHPPPASLFQLPPDRLSAIIDVMAACSAPTGRNADVWNDELARLRGWRDQAEARGGDDRTYFEIWGAQLAASPRPPADDVTPPLTPVPVTLRKDRAARPMTVQDARERLAARTGGDPSVVVVDSDNRVARLDGPDGRFLDLVGREAIGRDFADLIDRIAASLGAVAEDGEETLASNAVERSVRFGPTTRVRTITVVEPDAESGAQPVTTTIAVLEAAS
jgi:hypothetical protein